MTEMERLERERYDREQSLRQEERHRYEQEQERARLEREQIGWRPTDAQLRSMRQITSPNYLAQSQSRHWRNHWESLRENIRIPADATFQGEAFHHVYVDEASQVDFSAIEPRIMSAHDIETRVRGRFPYMEEVQVHQENSLNEAFLQPIIEKMAEKLVELNPSTPLNQVAETFSDLRTVRQLKKHGYTNLDQAMVKDILYLEQLGATTANDVSDWEVIALIGGLERGNKRAINKVFFEAVENKKQVLGEVNQETFARMQRALFESKQKKRNQQLTSAKNDYIHFTREVSTLNSRINDRIQNMREAYERVQLLEGMTEETTMQEFQKVLKNPFYTFDKFAFNTAHFHTTSDVVINYVNEAQGIRCQMNFGKIAISLNIDSNSLQAQHFENNLVTYDGYFHPFISSSGGICFGAAADAKSKMLVEGRYGDLFELLSALLVTYDGGSNPYVAIGEFQRQEKSGKAKRVTPGKCTKCENKIEDCNCPVVVKCGLCEEEGHGRGDCETYCHDCEEHNDNCTCDQSRCENCEELDENCNCEGGPF